jgi:hypothetical protein
MAQRDDRSDEQPQLRVASRNRIEVCNFMGAPERFRDFRLRGKSLAGMTKLRFVPGNTAAIGQAV